ncbi:MAG TPA: ABC transporter permease, partial [Clostridia bacterium]|nr:ABC transporter permease [Clostridia bacterium]
AGISFVPRVVATMTGNRELATIKVLGFYDRELAVYLYRENAVLTILGTGLGIWLGYYMERYVTLTSEVDLVMFSRDILWPSYVLSALLTLLFAAFVNLVMFRRLKNINMVSSLKSGE